MINEDYSNGHPVTWRELNLALKPVTAAIEQVTAAVRVLSDERIERISAAKERRREEYDGRRRRDDHRFWIGISAILCAALIGALVTIIVTIWWPG